MTKPLEELGREVREALGDGSSPEERHDQRQALVAFAANMPARTSRGRILSMTREHTVQALVGLAATATLTLGIVWMLGSRNESFSVHTAAGERVVAGSWLDTSTTPPLTLDFSDRSQVTLASGTQTTLGTLENDAVRFRLESGSLHARVTPGSPREWRFEGGPFSVVVLGTELDVDWDPERRSIEVSVQEGRVAVLGEGIHGGRVEVSAGERITISAPAPPKLERTKLDPPAQEAPPRTEEVPVEHESDLETIPAPREETRRRAPDVASWKALADQGKYERAFALAAQGGFSGRVRRSSASDAMLLADVARYAGRLDEAISALRIARKRFRTGQAGQQATFRLGRLALDQQGDLAGARTWFETYLKDYPRGRWAEKARGLRMSVLGRLGEDEAARSAAREYLDLHPSGPYRLSAEELLDEP